MKKADALPGLVLEDAMDLPDGRGRPELRPTSESAEDIAARALDRIEAECLRSGVEPRDACLLAVVEMLGALVAYQAWPDHRALLAYAARAARLRARQLAAENDMVDARPPLDIPRFGWARSH